MEVRGRNTGFTLVELMVDSSFGLPRNAFAVYAPQDVQWGINFNYQHPRGVVGADTD
ncbi:hypothetical protein ACFL4W_04485 [Planctomycetota bacterium]